MSIQMPERNRSSALRDWLGFPDAGWRDWLVGAGYTLFFLALFFIGGGAP